MIFVIASGFYWSIWGLVTRKRSFYGFQYFSEGRIAISNCFAVTGTIGRKRSPYCFCLVPRRKFSIVGLWTAVKIQVASLGTEQVFTSFSVGVAEESNPVMILYRLIMAKIEGKVNFLRGGKVDWIGVGDSFGVFGDCILTESLEQEKLGILRRRLDCTSTRKTHAAL